MRDTGEKNADELNERISREKEEWEGSRPRWDTCDMYNNGGKVVIDRMTELFNQVWEEESALRMWNE